MCLDHLGPTRSRFVARALANALECTLALAAISCRSWQQQQHRGRAFIETRAAAASGNAFDIASATLGCHLRGEERSCTESRDCARGAKGALVHTHTPLRALLRSSARAVNKQPNRLCAHIATFARLNQQHKRSCEPHVAQRSATRVVCDRSTRSVRVCVSNWSGELETQHDRLASLSRHLPIGYMHESTRRARLR